ncbi:MAG: hypothetical protein DHS20C17_13180 [Cyclobacteriaceae bacterium]|nr:MAG: hypothetical protein DHS20C17_13180 [Cyclobacteriaceae bacterium]
MGIIGRQTIKSTIYIYLGVVIGFFIRAHFFPNFLTTAQIGILALLVSYGSIFARVALLGFNHATIRYFPYFRNKEEGHAGFLSIYLMVITVGFLVFLVIYQITGTFWVENGKSELFSQYYFLCIPLTIGLLIYTVMDNYNTVLYNASTGVLIREFGLRILTLLSLVPLIYGLIGFNTFIKLYVGTFFIIALLMTGFIIWRGEFHLNFRFKKIDKSMLSGMTGISIFGLFTGLTTEVVLQINNILVNQYYDESQTGIYVTNFFFATLILIPSRGLNKIAPTMISDAFKIGDIKGINRIQFKSTINQLLIGVLIFIGLCINLDNIYYILPESFAIGSWVIILTGMANVIQMSAGVSSAIIGFSDYYRYNTFLSILQLVILIAVNLVLLPHFGITGAAVATLVASFVINYIKYLITKKKFGIQPYGKKHLLVLGIALLCLGFNQLIPVMEYYIFDIAVRSILISVVFVSINYFLKTSLQLNDNLNKALRMLRIR